MYCYLSSLHPASIYKIWTLKKKRYDLYLLTQKCIVGFLSSSWCNAIWKLYADNLSSYRVRNKVLKKFSYDPDLLTPKYIGIFLSHSCIYVWNMKAVHYYWKLLYKYNRVRWNNSPTRRSEFDYIFIGPQSRLRMVSPRMYINNNTYISY